MRRWEDRKRGEYHLEKRGQISRDKGKERYRLERG